MSTYYINVPVSDPGLLKPLRIGDTVVLNGDVYTARDEAHILMHECLERGEPLPFPVEGAAIYYVGPCPAREGQVIGSCGPTTSGRMDKYSPELLDLGVKLMIGKGLRNEAVRQSCIKNGAVYLAAIGGTGALISRCVEEVEDVAWLQLGTEAVRRFRVKNLVLTVAIDTLGNDLYHNVLNGCQ